MKTYQLVEKRAIADYESKKEAEADRDNNSLWFPENNYEVTEVEK